ncbi:hypothetical protein E2C01_047861 [Portunus trituberculatus]|uniref:Uncharacterized protein n=1 Tax=Portunus trituberculatus TaxID=210409 RepID=A0A5B7G905_PORTR|nr:hypothetical protein [Portunus trituberculatus]
MEVQSQNTETGHNRRDRHSRDTGAMHSTKKPSPSPPPPRSWSRTDGRDSPQGRPEVCGSRQTDRQAGRRADTETFQTIRKAF